MNPKSVSLSRTKAGKKAVPALGRYFGKLVARFEAGAVEEAKFDAMGDAGEQGKVHARPVIGRAKRKRFARTNLHKGE